MAKLENIRMLRQLLNEVRQASSSGKIRDSPVYRYIMDQFRKYSVTDQQLCKARDEMKFMCNSYLCYLRSSRRYDEITKTFHGRGERSIKETADMVGFKLPHDPKKLER